MRKSILALTFLFFSGAIATWSNDIYVAQGATGGANGADCADARTYTSLSRSDWSPGNTIHLCGTFSMPAGASGVINVGGSGTAGSPITVKFENGANATAPYWGGNGFIYAKAQNYITVDGGTNGTIQATANGTNLANQYTPSIGINFIMVSNSEIKNMTIANIYVHVCTDASRATCTDENGTQSTWGIYWVGGSNVSIDGNTIHDAYGDIFYGVPSSSTASNVNIFNNNTYDANWSICVGGGRNGNIVNKVQIYGNSVHDWGMWDDAANQNHHDGIFVYMEGPGSAYNDVWIYNNRIYGLIYYPFTAFIYASTNGGTNNFTFNNVLYNTGASYPADAYLYDYGIGAGDFNNTIVAPRSTNTGGNGYITYGSGSNLRNNIISTCYGGIVINPGASIGSSDYNDIYDCGSAGYSGGSWRDTLANWQSATGFDAHSLTGNPLLNSSSSPPYQLSGTSSSAYHSGTNLTSYCGTVPPLCSDAAGNPRPTTGPWDMGAYQYASGGSTGSTTPNPPSGLTATVN